MSRDDFYDFINRPSQLQRFDKDNTPKGPPTPNPLSGLKAHTIDTVIREVSKDWGDEFEQERPHLRARTLARIGHSIQGAITDRRWASVFAGERVHGEMTGLMSGPKTEVNINGIFRLGVAAAVSQMSDEEIAQTAAEEALNAPAAPVRKIRMVKGRV
jgi:hypothetical protein